MNVIAGSALQLYTVILEKWRSVQLIWTPCVVSVLGLYDSTQVNMSVMCVCEGDFGYYDNDGYFFVVDRLKELIKYNAYQVLTLQCARYQRLVSVSSREKLSTSRSRLGLGHLRLVPKTNFWPNCASHSTQCERALDVVSLCCSYYCSSY